MNGHGEQGWPFEWTRTWQWDEEAYFAQQGPRWIDSDGYLMEMEGGGIFVVMTHLPNHF